MLMSCSPVTLTSGDLIIWQAAQMYPNKFRCAFCTVRLLKSIYFKEEKQSVIFDL